MRLHRNLLGAALLFAVMVPHLSPEVQSKPAAKSTARHARGSKLTSPKYLEAVKTFNSKQYGPALRQFVQLDRTGMCCDMVHYYMALCCQHTNQVQHALQNYEYVANYTKDPRLKYYAESASAQLEYYSGHRSYEGQGNNFAADTGVGVAGGGGGGGSGGYRGG